jgi:hypothetical protein
MPGPSALTLWTSALLDALSRASAASEEVTFCLFTSICDELRSSSAGRFSADIMTVVRADVEVGQANASSDQLREHAVAKFQKVQEERAWKSNPFISLADGPMMIRLSASAQSGRRSGITTTKWRSCSTSYIESNVRSSCLARNW